MGLSIVALFGEAEKGEFRVPYIVNSVPQLHERVGNPPGGSLGIYYGVQTLLYHYVLLFFRVREEGFSYGDYIEGVRVLDNQRDDLAAICLPGVGDAEIIEAMVPVCEHHHSILIINEADLYDYLNS